MEAAPAVDANDAPTAAWKSHGLYHRFHRPGDAQQLQSLKEIERCTDDIHPGC